MTFQLYEARYSIECACGYPWHRLCLTIYKGKTPDLDDITLTLVVEGSSLWHRILCAWEVIKGRFEYHDFYLDEAGFMELEAAIANAKRIHERVE